MIAPNPSVKIVQPITSAARLPLTAAQTPPATIAKAAEPNVM